MKYLAVVEIRDESYSLEDVLVITGISEAIELMEEVGEYDDDYSYVVTFYPFEDPEIVIKKFKHTPSNPQEETFFAKSQFLSFIKKYDNITLSEMNEYEITGLYKRKTGLCCQCGLHSYECKCKLNSKNGITCIKI